MVLIQRFFITSLNSSKNISQQLPFAIINLIKEPIFTTLTHNAAQNLSNWHKVLDSNISGKTLHVSHYLDLVITFHHYKPKQT